MLITVLNKTKAVLGNQKACRIKFVQDPAGVECSWKNYLPDIGYQWATVRKVTVHLRKTLILASKWEGLHEERNLPLGDMCTVNKLSVNMCTVMFGIRTQAAQIYEGEGIVHKIMNFVGKEQFCDSDLKGLLKGILAFVRDIKGTIYPYKGLPRLKFERLSSLLSLSIGKAKKFSHRPKSEYTIMVFLFIPSHGSVWVNETESRVFKDEILLVIVDVYSRSLGVKFP
ncbi:hypothetical protein Tco_1338949 [Tanacetum coccineum]